MRVRRRKHMALHRGPAPVPAGPRERWSMDFVHDALADGRPFRILTVVDQWSRQSPVLEVAASMSGLAVGAALDRVLRGSPGLRSTRPTTHPWTYARCWTRDSSAPPPQRPIHPANLSRGNHADHIHWRRAGRHGGAQPIGHLERGKVMPVRAWSRSPISCTLPKRRGSSAKVWR